MLDLDHLEKAQRVSLTMQVEISLKGALITGSLKPGARLITKEIADKLGTSITRFARRFTSGIGGGCTPRLRRPSWCLR